ncbi:hypothetical protein G6F43_007374 [Rhizopus delemar]|nr:hypothetical protein G6F43_007374 [Rhizopus delemar]
MFLSHSANKSPDKSGVSAPSNPSASSQSDAKKPKPIPYTKVHRIATKIQETSQSLGSPFFDATSRKEFERTLYQLAFYQFQNFVGQLVHKSGANRYLEINFDDEENKNEAIAKGLQFDNGHIIIRPAVGLTPGSIIKKINLQKLLWLRPKELLAGLTATLSNYGVIGDIGIIRDADTSAFLGSGYTTLEITPTLVSEGNNAAVCPASPSGRCVCYQCLECDHLCADCPLKKTGLKRSRQGKPVAKAVSPSVPQPNIESTTEILSDSPLLPTQTAQTDKEAAVPMTRETPILSLLISTPLMTLLPHQFLNSLRLPRQLSPKDSRCVLARVSHVHDRMNPFHILFIYALASSHPARVELFNSLLSFRQLSPYDPVSCVNHMIIAGDFNYSLLNSSSPLGSSVPTRWAHFLLCYFQNVMNDIRSLDTATFRRGEISLSTIDYIYLSQDMVINYVGADVEFLSPHWSDHTLLQVTCKVDFVDDTRPVLWRANPIYTSNKEYRQQLAFMLTRLYDQEIANSISPPQGLWDLEVTPIAILKAERTWGERGEMDARYLKRSATARAVQRSIPRLWDPDNVDICPSRTQMFDVAQKFFAKLYSPEPVYSSALDAMVSNILSSCQLSKDDSEFMASSFLLDEILDQTSRLPKISRPGIDGLSYKFLKLIFKHPKYSDLIERVYNDAISSSLFPQSWLQTCVCLLPKKVDLTRLHNWRPITLINCDVKVFIRLLNARMVTVTPPLISSWKSSFMKE